MVGAYVLPVRLAASGAAADGPGTAQLCLQEAVVICAVSAPHHRSLRDLRLLAFVPLTAAASLRHQSPRRQLSCADIPAVSANLCRSGIRPLPGSVVLILAAAIELFAGSPTLRTQSSGALSTDQFGSETTAYYRN